MTNEPITDTALAIRRAYAIQRLLEGELATLAIRQHAQESVEEDIRAARAAGEDERALRRLELADERYKGWVTRAEENIDALRAVLQPLRFLIPEYGTDDAV